MGNKSGKFNVPATEKVNKDDEVVVNDGENKVDASNGVEANGDQAKHEANGTDKTEAAPEAKKKNIVSWFKKVSLRKEKKPKPPKENGVKEENVEEPKENGVKEEATIKENGNCDTPSEHIETKEDIVEVNQEEKEVPTETEHKDETPIANGHGNDTDNAEETPNEQ